MTIKPLISDTVLRHIDEDNKRFFRTRISVVKFSCNVYRINEDGTINTEPCISYIREAHSFTEILVYLPELIVEIFNNNIQYESHSYYTTVVLDITPIVGRTVTMVLDPIDFLPHLLKIRNSQEHSEILTKFNTNEQTTLDRMVEKEQ